MKLSPSGRHPEEPQGDPGSGPSPASQVALKCGLAEQIRQQLRQHLSPKGCGSAELFSVEAGDTGGLADRQ